MSYILTTMKTLRLIGTTLLMVMLAVNFTACSDDEDEQTIIEQANLIGKWQTTWEKIHKVENDKEVVTSDEAYTNGLWEFKADGTCTEGYADGGYTETSRWSLKDNKLTISYDDGYSDVLTVNELTATSWFSPLRIGTQWMMVARNWMTLQQPLTRRLTNYQST